jgi:hypothetical protein
MSRPRSGQAPLDVRAWTGHSALSSATSTPRPHIATAGERRTRVSGMRFPAIPVAMAFLDEKCLRSGHLNIRAQKPGRYQALSG